MGAPSKALCLILLHGLHSLNVLLHGLVLAQACNTSTATIRAGNVRVLRNRGKTKKRQEKKNVARVLRMETLRCWEHSDSRDGSKYANPLKRVRAAKKPRECAGIRDKLSSNIEVMPSNTRSMLWARFDTVNLPLTPFHASHLALPVKSSIPGLAVLQSPSLAWQHIPCLSKCKQKQGME